MLATDLLADLFFMADVVLNFNTGFIKDQVQLGSSAAQPRSLLCLAVTPAPVDVCAQMRGPVVVCAIPVLFAAVMPAG